ncbi:MAG: S8 family serine peptidase, partial [Burkholderiales bacterium]
MRSRSRRTPPPSRLGATLGLVLSLACAGPVRAADPAAFEAEAAASSTALRVGAPSAWSRGGLGAGVVVGLLDSGVLDSHGELAGRLLRGYDALTGGTDTRDGSGHGTHVAGLVAAARDGAGITGVAPEAWILPVRVFAGEGATDAVLSSGVRWAAARAGILNLSLAASAPIAGAALRDATASGALVVVAAGNRGAAHPDWPARFAREAWANGPGARGAIVAVGAVDAENRIAPWSNRAGDTAQWYLVAPGVGVLSSYAGVVDAYARVAGRAMAAPAVSGAAALLESCWRRLSPREA